MEKSYNPTDIESIFEDYLKSGNISSITKRNYLSDVRKFNQWVVTNFAFTLDKEYFQETSERAFLPLLQGLQIKHIYAYLDFLRANIQTTNVINRNLSSLRKYFAFLMEKEIVRHNLMAEIHNYSEDSKKVNPRNNIELLLDSFEAEVPALVLPDGLEGVDCVSDVREYYAFIAK